MGDLSGAFRALRDGLGMSQEKFATAIGVSHATVGRVEKKGALYRYDAILAIEKLCGAPIDVLLQPGSSPDWMKRYRKLTPEKRAKIDGLMEKALELVD